LLSRALTPGFTAQIPLNPMRTGFDTAPDDA
jgi:hypothetical protein